MAGFMTATTATPIVRQGPKLMIPAPPPGEAVTLPPLCVRCGAAADGKPLEKTFYWHHPALFLLVLAGLLIYAIVALVVRKSIKIRVPLCAQHAQRRSLFVTLAWVLPLIGIADAFVLPQFNVDGGLVALICIAFLLTGLIIWVVVSNPITPKFIDSTRGEFTGFCEAFLQLFPDAATMAPAVRQPGAPAPPGVPPPPLA